MNLLYIRKSAFKYGSHFFIVIPFCGFSFLPSPEGGKWKGGIMDLASQNPIHYGSIFHASFFRIENYRDVTCGCGSRLVQRNRLSGVITAKMKSRSGGTLYYCINANSRNAILQSCNHFSLGMFSQKGALPGCFNAQPFDFTPERCGVYIHLPCGSGFTPVILP